MLAVPYRNDVWGYHLDQDHSDPFPKIQAKAARSQSRTASGPEPDDYLEGLHLDPLCPRQGVQTRYVCNGVTELGKENPLELGTPCTPQNRVVNPLKSCAVA
jgi:hypothetical protein